MSFSQRNIITGHNMKIIITENRLEQVALNWLNKNYGNLKPFETEKYPNYIFYRKGDKIIFYYNKENGYVYVDYNEIWLFFESYFGMEYQQIQDITKIWVEEHYKLGVTTTAKGLRPSTTWWRNITN